MPNKLRYRCLSDCGMENKKSTRRSRHRGFTHPTSFCLRLLDYLLHLSLFNTPLQRLLVCTPPYWKLKNSAPPVCMIRASITASFRVLKDADVQSKYRHSTAYWCCSSWAIFIVHQKRWVWEMTNSSNLWDTKLRIYPNEPSRQKQ